jgi:hypothetical protein
MTDLRTAAHQALAALERVQPQVRGAIPIGDVEDAIAALRVALAQPEQEPVAWRIGKSYWSHYESIPSALLPPANTPQPLFAAPPRREWVSLTDEEIDSVTDAQWAANNHKPIYAAHRASARAIEAKLKEKNT